MGKRSDILNLLWKYDLERYNDHGEEIADSWMEFLFNLEEVEAWFDYGVFDAEDANARRGDTEDVPPYYNYD